MCARMHVRSPRLFYMVNDCACSFMSHPLSPWPTMTCCHDTQVEKQRAPLSRSVDGSNDKIKSVTHFTDLTKKKKDNCLYIHTELGEILLYCIMARVVVSGLFEPLQLLS